MSIFAKPFNNFSLQQTSSKLCALTSGLIIGATTGAMVGLATGLLTSGPSTLALTTFGAVTGGVSGMAGATTGQNHECLGPTQIFRRAAATLLLVPAVMFALKQQLSPDFVMSCSSTAKLAASMALSAPMSFISGGLLGAFFSKKCQQPRCSAG